MSACERARARERRLNALMYSCESRDEICERMVDLEEIARDVWQVCNPPEETCEACPLHLAAERDGSRHWCDMEERLDRMGLLGPM